MQGKVRCPLFLDFRKNGVGSFLKAKLFSYWGHSTSEGISGPLLQVLWNESVCGRDKKKQLKPTDVYALKL